MARSVYDEINVLFLELICNDCTYGYFCGFITALLKFDHIDVSIHEFLTDAAYYVL